VKLFLDTSVLAACGSQAGASREIFRRASVNQWSLITTPYVIQEVVHNLDRLSPSGATEWQTIGSQLSVLSDVLTLDRPAVFGPAKDKPILFAALAWAEVLLTLDQADFGHLMSRNFCGLVIMRPAGFLEEQRSQKRLR
jgi:hypothetical protein